MGESDRLKRTPDSGRNSNRVIVVGGSGQAGRLAELYRNAGHEVLPATPQNVDQLARGAAAAFVHLADAGNRALTDLVRLAAPGGAPVGFPLVLNRPSDELSELMKECQGRDRPLMLAYAPLYCRSFQRLQHFITTGMAGTLNSFTLRLPGGNAQFENDLLSGDPHLSGCVGLAYATILAEGRIRVSGSDDSPADDMLTVRIESGGPTAGLELVVSGSASTIGLKLEGRAHTIWAARGEVRRDLVRLAEVDQLHDLAAAVNRFIGGQLRNLADGRSGLLLCQAFERVQSALEEQGGRGGSVRGPGQSGRGPAGNLDVYQKLPAKWGDGKLREAYWEAKFNIETVCNQDCVFCFARSTGMVFTDLDESPDLIGCLPGQGVKGIMFSGGEPTLNPRLRDYIEDAVRLGIEHITVESNAVLFADPERTKSYRDAGLGAAFVSFHSCRPDTVETLTRIADSFELVLAGVENLLAAGVEVHLNCVTNQYNYRELEELVRFVAAGLPGVSTMTLSFVAPLGRAFGRSDIVPRISDAAPYMTAALLAAESLGLSMSVPGRCGIPLCFLPGLERFFVEYRLRDHLDSTGPRILQDRVKVEECTSCRLDRFCQGLWPNYADMYGTDELKVHSRLIAEERGGEGVDGSR